jgi:hypothetical protein
MEQVINGIVEQVGSRPAGRGTAYSLKVNGTWYSVGFKNPNVQTGQEVSFPVTQNGQYWNLTKGATVSITGGGAAAQAPVQQAQQAASQGVSKDEYWKRKEEKDVEKDKRIQYLASRKDAIEVAKLLNDAGALKLPAKQADKCDALLAFIGELTEQYAEEATNCASASQVNPAAAEGDFE